MEQYINKAALVAEIEKELNATKKYSTEYINGKKYALKKILSILDTLETKDVDLEKEKDDYWNKLCDFEFGELLERDAKWFDDIAKHFFELGLKQKGE